MENKPNEYEPGIDQNQGVVGTMARHEQHGDTESEGTQLTEMDPNLVTNQVSSSAEDEDNEPSTDTMGERKYIRDEGTD